MAVTASRATKSRNVQAPANNEHLMADDITLYKGTAVMINSAGLATGALAGAGNKGVPGVAMRTVTNPAGGAEKIPIEEGEFLLTGVALTQAEEGDVVFFADNETFSNVQGANEPQGGRLTEFVTSTSGWVRISAALAQ